MYSKKCLSAYFVLTLSFIMLTFLAGYPGHASERSILTVYQNGPSLLVTGEQVDLHQGANRITRSITSAAVPETLFVTSSKGDLRKSKITSYIDSEGKLLTELVGSKLIVTGSENTDSPVRGTLVAVLGNKPLIRTNDGKMKLIVNPDSYQFDPIEESSFNSLLEMELIADSGGETEITIGYQVSGVSWSPQYVGFLNEDKGKMFLRGMAHIRNETDRSFRGVELNLLAGQPARENERRNVFMMASAQESAQPKQSSPQQVFEYYRYTPDFPVDVNKNVDTGVKFLERGSVDFEKYYKFEPAASSAVRTILELNNSKEAGLGVPMAGGTVRIYEDTRERTFLGADKLPNLPKGKETELVLGDAFDVEATRARIVHEKVDERIWKDRIRVELKNRKVDPVRIEVIEKLSGSWEILKTSHDYTRLDSNRIRYEVTVAGKSSLQLSYTVQYRY